MAASPPPSKKQKTTTTDIPAYELIYWPSIPGRGEHVRLAFEATSTPYTDISNTTPPSAQAVLTQIAPSNLGSTTNPPPLAPPILKHGDLLLSQTPNILLYLAPKLGLAGPEGDENAIYKINALALTALDGLSNEVHETHHPIGPGLFYEDQKDEAKRRAHDFLSTRLPKFLGYFERVLQGEASAGGEWLYGGQLTYADLVLFQCLDGVAYAFPKKVGKVKEGGEFEKVWELYERVKGVEAVKEYLASERRVGYGQGIYRRYEELDEE